MGTKPSSFRRPPGLFKLAVLAGAACVAGGALAAPDAGSVMQQLRPAPPGVPRHEAPVLPEAPAARPAMADAGGAAVPLRQARITGATAFTQEQLLALLQDAIGRELDFAGLQALADRISRHYRQHGFTVARAYLPQQQISDGVVEIAVIEGRYGAITVRQAAAAPLPLAALVQGDLVSDAALERSLLLAADLPGIAVRSTLQPGASVGTSELVVDVQPGERYAGSIEADNFGSTSTGRARAGGTLSINNPAGLGDLVTLRALTSGKGLAYGRAAYQLPVGGHGTRVGAAASTMHYRLGEEFESLDANGTAHIATLFVAYPVVRSRGGNLNVQLSAEGKRLQDRADSVASVTDKSVRALNLGVSADRTDDSGAWAFSATYTRGDLRIGSAAAQAADDAGPRTAGAFDKVGWSLLRQQALGEATSVLVSWTGQWAGRNLDSSEKLPLGGAGAVRAYPQGEAPSDHASLLTLELRHALGNGWQAIAFVDSGTGRANAESFAGAGEGRRSRSGAGLGLNWAGARGWAVRAFYAHKLGNARATAEADRSGRLWLQASRSF